MAQEVTRKSLHKSHGRANNRCFWLRFLHAALRSFRPLFPPLLPLPSATGTGGIADLPEHMTRPLKTLDFPQSSVPFSEILSKPPRRPERRIWNEHPLAHPLLPGGLKAAKKAQLAHESCRDAECPQVVTWVHEDPTTEPFEEPCRKSNDHIRHLYKSLCHKARRETTLEATRLRFLQQIGTDRLRLRHVPHRGLPVSGERPQPRPGHLVRAVLVELRRPSVPI